MMTKSWGVRKKVNLRGIGAEIEDDQNMLCEFLN